MVNKALPGSFEVKGMKKGKKNIKLRIIAGVLVLIMVFTYWAGAVTSIKIAADSSNEAMKYLAENTDYVKSGRSIRVWNLLSSMIYREDPDDLYNRASIYIGAARYEEALIYIGKCLELCDEQNDPDLYIDLLTKKGCLLALVDRNDEALEVLTEVVNRSPEAADIYLVLAQIYLEEEEPGKLAEATAKYLELKPDDLEVRITYLQALAAADDLVEAKRQSEIIVSDKSVTTEQCDDVYHTLSVLALKDEQFEEALEYLDKIEDTENSWPDVDYDKGVCKMSMSEFEEAIDCFSQSIEKGYDVQDCYYSRGVCELSGDTVDIKAAYYDLKAAAEYEGEDRDEETAALAKSVLDAAYSAEKQD